MEKARLATAAVLLFFATHGVAEQKYPLTAPLDGPTGPYTQILLDLVKEWPPKETDLTTVGSGLLRLQCFDTPGDSDVIGIEQVMHVAAPLARVKEVVDDIDHYKEIFSGYDDIHVEERDGNRWLTFWEQHIPVFLVPNVKYRMTYLIDTSVKGRVVYRYQLKAAGQIKTSDGIIVLEDDGQGATRYTEYDFFKAEYGLLKTFAPGRIWKDSVEGMFLSDVAFKLRAEHPDWSLLLVHDKAKKALEGFPAEEVSKNRKVFYRWSMNPK